MNSYFHGLSHIALVVIKLNDDFTVGHTKVPTGAKKKKLAIPLKAQSQQRHQIGYLIALELFPCFVMQMIEMIKNIAFGHDAQHMRVT